MMEKLKKLLSSVWGLYRDAQKYRLIKQQLDNTDTYINWFWSENPGPSDFHNVTTPQGLDLILEEQLYG